jgi:hypothetical protein
MMIVNGEWNCSSGDPNDETKLKASENAFAPSLYCAEEKSLVSSADLASSLENTIIAIRSLCGLTLQLQLCIKN